MEKSTVCGTDAIPTPRRRPGVWAWFPRCGRHYVYHATAWHAKQQADTCHPKTSSGHQRLTPKQQRRLQKRRDEETLWAASSGATATIEAQTHMIPLDDWFTPVSASVNTDAPSFPGTVQHGNDVICLALMDVQHQPMYAQRLLSRIVSLCQSPYPVVDPLATDASSTHGTIHGWVLLQSSHSALPSLDVVDAWLEHSGVTLVWFDLTDNPTRISPMSMTMSTRAAETSRTSPRSNAVNDTAQSIATLPINTALNSEMASFSDTTSTSDTVASTSDAVASPLQSVPPVPFSSWVWTAALGIHSCPSVALFDARTGRRMAVHQHDVVLRHSEWTTATRDWIRDAWLVRRTTADTSWTAPSVCHVQ